MGRCRRRSYTCLDLRVSDVALHDCVERRIHLITQRIKRNANDNRCEELHEFDADLRVGRQADSTSLPANWISRIRRDALPKAWG
jgi:hypothetical protein